MTIVVASAFNVSLRYTTEATERYTTEATEVTGSHTEARRHGGYGGSRRATRGGWTVEDPGTSRSTNQFGLCPGPSLSTTRRPGAGVRPAAFSPCVPVNSVPPCKLR
jgi:hypothetical protein